MGGENSSFFSFCENVDLRSVVVWLVRGGIFCDKFWEQRKKEAQEIGLFGAEKVKSVTIKREIYNLKTKSFD